MIRPVDSTNQRSLAVAAIRANKTMIGNMVREFRDSLARRNLKLPELEIPGLGFFPEHRESPGRWRS